MGERTKPSKPGQKLPSLGKNLVAIAIAILAKNRLLKPCVVVLLRVLGDLKVDPKHPVIIGGSEILKRAFEILIKNDDYFRGKLHVIDDKSMQDMAGFGSIAAAKARGLVKEE